MTIKVLYNVSNDGVFSLSEDAISWMYDNCHLYGIDQEDFVDMCNKYGFFSEPEDYTSERMYVFPSEVLPRHHQMLIDCVECVGLKYCAGPNAHLIIVELNSSKYMIENEYGVEHIVTPDMLEWIEI